jgi:peroxiredoxin Q/BCP
MGSSTTPLEAGDPAPGIRSGAFELSQLRGKRVVIFFFPKSDTPGCTKEACEFRDSSKKFVKANAEIVGISPDKSEAQQKFAAKYSLPFTFVPDPDHAIAEAYGVWKEKSMYGRKYMGIERSTFVIGVDGKVERVFSKVKPEGHAAQVLESLVEPFIPPKNK